MNGVEERILIDWGGGKNKVIDWVGGKDKVIDCGGGWID